MTRENRSPTGETDKQDASDERLSLSDTLKRFVSAARETVDAELSLARIRATLIGTAAKWIAILSVIAIVTAFAMIVTLMIGAVLALAPLWGLGWALLAVAGGALLAILLCGLGIKAQVGRLSGAIR